MLLCRFCSQLYKRVVCAIAVVVSGSPWKLDSCKMKVHESLSPPLVFLMQLLSKHKCILILNLRPCILPQGPTYMLRKKRDIEPKWVELEEKQYSAHVACFY